MSRIKLLVVDDETDFLKLVKRRLERRNFDVAVASGGAEALRYLSGNSVDVVILDVRMPGMSGMEALKHICRKHSDVEVIMLTGHSSVASGLEGISHGAYDYILKPFDIDDLIERIRNAYERAMLRRKGGDSNGCCSD
ncbi:sigma-54-dependent transcriptional regulator [Maridesulfovibrio sp.]|uniref:sigma-54-dependent transcriptional regulator n=1 Tax=Maridesulfovibrio sp. TaxID=2795000 RepID=UPI0029F4CC0D|nr:response regulator [Maridesulfovibrio sp.]